MKNNKIGKNYNKNLSTKELAGKVKKYIKNKYDFICPKIRTKYNLIILTLEFNKEIYANNFKELDDKDYRKLKIEILNQYDSLKEDELNNKVNSLLITKDIYKNNIKKIIEDIENYVDSYNFDNSVVEYDYFNYNFYTDLKIKKIPQSKEIF